METPIKVTVNTIHDIAPEKRFMIDELTIVGKFQVKTDIPILRSMCNTIVDGKRTGGKLSVVNLSQCDIAYSFGSYTINPYSFGCMSNCIALKRLTLPSQIRLCLGSYFPDCKSLESISIVGYLSPTEWQLNGKFYDKDGVLFHTKGNEHVLVKFPANKSSEYVMPNDTTGLENSAFEDCHLTRLTMPQVPPTCDKDAFKGVNILDLTLVIPKGSHDSYWMHPVFGNFKLEEMDE